MLLLLLLLSHSFLKPNIRERTPFYRYCKQFGVCLCESSTDTPSMLPSLVWLLTYRLHLFHTAGAPCWIIDHLLLQAPTLMSRVLCQDFHYANASNLKRCIYNSVYKAIFWITFKDLWLIGPTEHATLCHFLMAIRCLKVCSTWMRPCMIARIYTVILYSPTKIQRNASQINICFSLGAVAVCLLTLALSLI